VCCKVAQIIKESFILLGFLLRKLFSQNFDGIQVGVEESVTRNVLVKLFGFQNNLRFYKIVSEIM
jgi:hypothetical protein